MGTVLVASAPGQAVGPAQHDLVAGTPCRQAPEQGHALVRQHDVAHLAGLGAPDYDRAGVSVEISHFQLAQFAVAAARRERRLHQWPKRGFCGVDQPLRLGDGEVPQTSGVDALEWSHPAPRV
jgi:hypothetical protein